MLTTILIKTLIAAPIKMCFDLSRSIEFHQYTTRKTGEKAIGGKTNGLIELHESVTWEATHFFIRQRLTSKITVFNSPCSFTDSMTEGAFKSLHHNHIFEQIDQHTCMTDVFIYEVPFGVMGEIFNRIILKRYMTDLLKERNDAIKNAAESGEWKKYLAPTEF
jgi:ligand-binding SRPBCC domain-containing protein